GGNLQVHASGFRAKANRLPLLPLENADAVIQAARAQPNVIAATRRIATAGIVSSHGNSVRVAITAIEPTIEAPLSLQAANITQGRFLSDEDGDAILIGQALAERLQVGLGDSITLLGRSKNESMRRHTMTIVGIYDLHTPEVEKGSVYIPLIDGQTLYNLRGQATEVAIFMQQVGTEDSLMSALQAQLPSYEVDTWQTLKPEIRQTMQTKLMFTSFIGIVVLIIAGIGILNLMLMAVFERTREMGVLAALGMKGRQIMGLFLLEGAFIGAAGAVVGCGLGALLIGWMGKVGIDLSGLSGSGSGMGEVMALLGDRLYPSVTPADLLSRGLLAILIAAIASLYPAWQASRQEPAQALHHV
ncbi:MAG TPA: FtsX-like permease family protein, partial [Roseiflexaceae bacterium]|nr:FtsX-like permease family protein [Roseiflexaceae bacterium]